MVSPALKKSPSRGLKISTSGAAPTVISMGESKLTEFVPSETVKVTSNVPLSSNVWVTLAPVPWSPSPKFQV